MLDFTIFMRYMCHPAAHKQTGTMQAKVSLCAPWRYVGGSKPNFYHS